MSQSTGPADDSTYGLGLDTGQDDVVDLDEVMGSDNVDEVLDTSWSPPERPVAVDDFGTTLAEQRAGETLDQRLAQEEPDPTAQLGDPDPDPAEGRGALEDGEQVGEGDLDDGEVGGRRAGRLVDTDEGARADLEKDLIGRDVGIDGGAAGAEEAAVHVIDE